jgi:hypothetical protein
MNIAFIAHGFLQRRGGETTDIYNLSYLILGADQTTKQQKIQKKPQMNADERRSITSAQNPQNRTRMTRIGQIFTDTFYPCVSASTVAPVDVAHTYGSRHTWRSVFSRFRKNQV